MRHPISVQGNEFAAGGTNRREFIKIVTMAAASVGLTSSTATRIAEAATRGLKPSVVWLHFQACTGCTESLLRTSHPAIAELILDLISLDYNETLFAAAGHQAEDALEKAMAENAGKYVCIIEGAIPTKDNGIYCKIAGRTAIDLVTEVAGKAGAIIAIGSCAIMGRNPLRRPEPDWGDRRTHGSQGEDCGDDPRMPGESLQPARDGPPVRDSRDPSRARREGKAQVGVRPSDPRGLSASGPFRRRPLRAEVRRRGAPAGLLPLQARLQGAGDPRELLPPPFWRDGSLADRHRAPVHGVHRARDRVPRPDAHHDRHRSTHPPIPTRRSTPSRVTSAPWPPASEALCAERSRGRGGWRPGS